MPADAMDPRPTSRRVLWLGGAALVALAGGGAAWWLLHGGDDDLSACNDRAWVEQVTAASAQVHFVHAFAPAWVKLRDDLCRRPADERPGNAAARLRCLDGRGRELIALAHLIATEHPARVPGPWAFLVPYECASDHAAELAALEPDAPRADAVVAIRFALAQDHPPLDALAAQADAIGFAPLVHELALARATAALVAGNAAPLADVATAAERDHHVMVAAYARLQLLLRALADADDRMQVHELFDRSDVAIAAAGDPPSLRARWFAVQSGDARSTSDPRRVRGATERAERLIDAYELAVDPRLLDDLAASYSWLGNQDQALAYYKRALELAKMSTPADQMMAESYYGIALIDANKPDEVLARLRAVVAISETARFEPPERATAVLQYVRAANTGAHYAHALETLDTWQRAITALPPNAMLVGRFRYERAVALMATARLDDAGHELDGALAIFRQRLGAASSLTADAQIFGGQIAYQRHHLEQARDQLERGIADMIGVDGDDAPRVAQGRVWLAKTLLALGDVEHARPVIDRALAVFGKSAVGPDDYAEAEVVRARLLPESERAQAVATLEHALTLWRKDAESWKAEIAEVEAQLAVWKHR